MKKIRKIKNALIYCLIFVLAPCVSQASPWWDTTTYLVVNTLKISSPVEPTTKPMKPFFWQVYSATITKHTKGVACSKSRIMKFPQKNQQYVLSSCYILGLLHVNPYYITNIVLRLNDKSSQECTFQVIIHCDEINPCTIGQHKRAAVTIKPIGKFCQKSYQNESWPPPPYAPYNKYCAQLTISAISPTLTPKAIFLIPTLNITKGVCKADESKNTKI